VPRAVIRFIESNWMSGEQVEIITGNSPRMKRIVTDLLDVYTLNFQVGFMGLNTGRIAIDME